MKNARSGHMTDGIASMVWSKMVFQLVTAGTISETFSEHARCGVNSMLFSIDVASYREKKNKKKSSDRCVLANSLFRISSVSSSFF